MFDNEGYNTILNRYKKISSIFSLSEVFFHENCNRLRNIFMNKFKFEGYREWVILRVREDGE